MNTETFEEQLKQLRPAHCGNLMADTFYQSGWNACEESLGQRCKNFGGFRRAMPTFAAGLVCGLMLFLGSFLWSAQSGDSHQTIVVEHPVSKSGGEKNDESSERERTHERPKVVLTRPLGRGWEIDDLFNTSPLSIKQSSPLSLAAKNGWTAQIQAGSHPLTTSKVTGDLQRETLTSSPLNKRLLNELML